MAREFREGDHPRHPRGSREGGRFRERWAQEVSSRLSPGQAPETYGTSEIAGKRYDLVQARLALCYMMAGHALVLGTAPQDAKLVHGTIHHVLAGHSIEHAWLELPDGSVWEPTQGKTWSAMEWQAIFRPRDTVSYTVQQARERMLESGNYGPWEVSRLSGPDPLDAVKARAAKQGVDLIAYRLQDGGAFKVQMIKTEKGLRNQGRGRAAMQDLIELADQEGLPIVLTPDPSDDSGLSRRRLIAWYRSLGFVPSRGRNNWTWDSMMRFPRGGE